MCLVGALPWVRGIFLLVAQILGGITAAAITSALLPGPLMVRTNLGGGTSVVQGLFIEMFLTAELVFTIFMLAAEKHKGTCKYQSSHYISSIIDRHSHRSDRYWTCFIHRRADGCLLYGWCS